MRLRVAPSFLLLFALTACGDDEVTSPQSGTLDLEFSHYVGAEPLAADLIQYVNAAGNQYGVENLFYYVSNITLRGPEGVYETDLIHYVDAADEESHGLHIHDVPARHYHQLQFTFGLDAEHNTTGALGTDPVHLNMQWPDPMGGGYHYMKLEGKFMKNGIPTNFATHTGRLRETDGSQSHHFFTVTLDLHRDILPNQTLNAEVIMDVNEWYATPNVIDLEAHAGGIMGNTTAQDLIEENGASVFRFGELGGTGHDDEEGM